MDRKIEQDRKITECCICSDTFSDPRILSCIHTFCLKCLEKSATSLHLKPGDTMKCPLCTKPFEIPMKGMTCLQTNLFLERLVDIFKLSAPANNAIFCDLCMAGTEGEAQDVTPAVQYCIQCQQNICDRCCQYHRRIRDLQNHQLVERGSPLKDELIKKASLQHCRLHRKEEAKLFCADCKDVICMMCFVQKHQLHHCSDVEEVAEEFRTQIKCDLQKMRDFVEKTAERIQKMESIQLNFQKQVEVIEKAIIQKEAELKELVTRCTRSLLDELDVIKQRVEKQNKCKRDESEAHKMIIQSFETYCTELSSKGSSAEVCSSANDVHLRSEELQTDHQKHIAEKIASTKVKFEDSDVKEFLKKENIAGKIREIADQMTTELRPIIQLMVDAGNERKLMFVKLTDDVDDFYRRVSKELLSGISPQAFALMYTDKYLHFGENKKLADYDLQHLSMITLMRIMNS